MTDPTALPSLPPPSGAQPNGTQPPAGRPTEPPAEAPLTDRVRDALVDMGLEARVDDDGDVAFRFNDQQLFVRCEDESNVMRVFGQWALEDPVPTDLATRLEVCNDLNVSFNLLKAAVAQDTLLVTSEHILPRNADVRGLLGLAVPLVIQGVQLWHQRATGQLGDGGDDGTEGGSQSAAGAGEQA